MSHFHARMFEEVDEYYPGRKEYLQKWELQHGSIDEKIKNSECIHCIFQAQEMDDIMYKCFDDGKLLWWHMRHGGKTGEKFDYE